MGPESDPECTRWVKDAVRARHAATSQMGVGPWTVIEEYMGIDLLAFAAWPSATPRTPGVKNPIVGYEVKVSRADYRRELLKPSKRKRSVARCNQFYFAVPRGLLTKEELAWHEPEHHQDGSAFVRDPCPARCQRMKVARRRYGSQHVPQTTKTGKWVPVPVAMGQRICRARQIRRYGTLGPWRDYDPGREPRPYEGHGQMENWEVCQTCEGRGYLARSIVEEEAPTLWVPADVGLIEVNAGGVAKSVKKAPVRTHDETRGDWVINDLVRWVSCRPDPRHATRRR